MRLAECCAFVAPETELVRHLPRYPDAHSLGNIRLARSHPGNCEYRHDCSTPRSETPRCLAVIEHAASLCEDEERL